MESDGKSLPTAVEIGEDLIDLLTSTATRTGLQLEDVAWSVSDLTGVRFNVSDGKLNISEEALLNLGPQMLNARIHCEGLVRPLVSPPKPIPNRSLQQTKPVRHHEVSDAGLADPKLWMLGLGIVIASFAVLAFLLRNADPYVPPRPRPMSAEDKLIRDAVTLQRMIDADQKRINEKFKKEYERQERSGR